MTAKLLMLFLLSGALCAAQLPSRSPQSLPQPCAEDAQDASAAADGCSSQSAPAAAPAPEDSLPPAPRVAQPLPPSEFEVFAQDAAGSPLPVFGRQLFAQAPTTFAPLGDVPVPADYVIGPGDQLLIRVWGKIDLAATVTVDRNGQIFLPRVGTFSVIGLRFDQLQGFLRSAIGDLYKGFELNVTMGQLRSIQIFVLGSARQPGVYTVSSLSTLVNALFASGGPSATGSMRRIQLRRGGKLVTGFDLYNLLRNGDNSRDVQLLPGDVIYIPPVGPRVALAGSVNEPGIYELKDEATVATVLNDAGGLSNVAESNRALLERIENHARRRVDEFPLDGKGLERVLRDGDILRVYPISPRFENAVTLRGNVAQPGRYLWRQGMRVSDLIPSRNFLITRTFWNRENHLAGASQPLDSGGNSLVDALTDLNENNAEINWSYASIERLDQRDLSTRVIAFNLGAAIGDRSAPDNQLLEPGDVVTIYSRSDLPLPQNQQAAFVRITGEVNAPGVYRIEPGETLRSAVERAGGLTAHSYLYASQLTRASTRREEELQLQLSINQMQRELLSRYAAAPAPVMANSGDQQEQLRTQQALIAQLAEVHPTGRIVLDMKPRASAIADIPAFPLEDGDSFYVPPRLNTVQVAGAVYNENAFRYQPGKPLSAYLSSAGGPTRQADKARIFLIRADGTVISRQSRSLLWRDSFENLTLLPGDAIVVPNRMKSPNSFAQQLPFVAQILSATALTGAVAGMAY